MFFEIIKHTSNELIFKHSMDKIVKIVLPLICISGEIFVIYLFVTTYLHVVTSIQILIGILWLFFAFLFNFLLVLSHSRVIIVHLNKSQNMIVIQKYSLLRRSQKTYKLKKQYDITLTGMGKSGYGVKLLFEPNIIVKLNVMPTSKREANQTISILKQFLN
jgi:membrane glycosyltransferase